MVGIICVGCDLPVPVDDLGLCRECSAKLDRDLIRSRDWAYSVTAALTPESERETLRLDIMARYGPAYELIEPSTKAERQAHKPKQRGQAIEPRAAGTYTEKDILDSLEHVLAVEGNNWREWDEVARLLRREYPDFDPKTYGFKSLRRLIQAHPKRFHTRWDDPKHKRHARLYVRLTKATTPKPEA
jgi:Fe-S-cluster formation regulator IscX/YfhJ